MIDQRNSQMFDEIYLKVLNCHKNPSMQDGTICYEQIDFSYLPLDLLDLLMDLMTCLEQDHSLNQERKKDKDLNLHQGVVYPWPKHKFMQRMRECYASLSNMERGQLMKLVKKYSLNK